MNERKFHSLVNLPLPELVWAKVDKDQIGTGCWVWTGAITAGYGMIGREISGRRTTVMAHRAVWTMVNGEIPEGLVIDHLCRNRCCVNPGHMEPTTSKINTHRSLNSKMICFKAGTCVNGHKIEPGNMRGYVDSKNGVYRYRCAICQRAIAKNTYDRKMAKKRGLIYDKT